MKTNDEIRDMANYIIENKATVRETAKIFKISKSSVYYLLVNRRLPFDIKNQLKEIWTNNFNNKHINGGMAMKKKYNKI